MPIRPSAMSYECPTCGWAKTIEPLSDVLLEAPPDVCPKCGDQHIDAQSVFSGQPVFSALTNAFRKIFP
jgi:NAD-dependent SIR2 family protein deacetylase